MLNISTIKTKVNVYVKSSFKLGLELTKNSTFKEKFNYAMQKNEQQHGLDIDVRNQL